MVTILMRTIFISLLDWFRDKKTRPAFKTWDRTANQSKTKVKHFEKHFEEHAKTPWSWGLILAQ